MEKSRSESKYGMIFTILSRLKSQNVLTCVYSAYVYECVNDECSGKRRRRAQLIIMNNIIFIEETNETKSIEAKSN